MKIKRVLLFSALILFLLLALSITILTIPIYPDFHKEVKSYEDLKVGLSSGSSPLLPETSIFDLEDEVYSLILDGRTLVSKPVGFLITGTHPQSNTTVHINISSEITQSNALHGDTIYQGVHISTNENTSESIKNLWMKFSMNKFEYTAHAYYDVSGLSIDEQSVINNEITGQLTLILHELIDT
jgi:hypothetical protein